MKPTKQDKPQPRSLKAADYYNGFLKRAANNQLTLKEIKVTRIEARFSAVPLAKMDEAALIIGLTKIITDIFDYFNTDYNASLVNILVNDILEDYKQYSILEIYKALHDGRKNQGSLYGKLSGRHLTAWIQDYMMKLDQDIVEYRIKEKDQRNRNLNELSVPGIQALISIPETKEDRKITPAEMSAEINRLKIQDRDREEYRRKWDYNKHGDYETYMNHYKPQNDEQ